MRTKALGMNIKYLKASLISSILILVGMILPLVNTKAGSPNTLSILAALCAAGAFKKALPYGIVALSACLIVVLNIILNIKPNRVLALVTVAISAIETAVISILLFSSKALFDSSKIFEEKFLVKDFGVGYWLILIASYAALYTVLKTAKEHPGYIVLVILSIIWLFPVLWIVLTALREESGYYVGYFFPKGLTLNNFKELFSDNSLIHFGRWWTNTLFVAVFNCFTTTVIVLMTAYVLSRTRFSWRTKYMKIMLIIGMFPGFMSMIAVYNILKGLGIAQTLWALILVNAAGAAGGYYIVKGFFDTIPKSLDEAALLDGATKFQVFTKVTIPMSKSVIIYTILTSFMGPWGDYIFPSMMLGDNQSQYTVALGLNWLTDFRRIDAYYTQFAAGALLVSLPIVILFIALQRFYVEGMSGAVKG